MGYQALCGQIVDATLVPVPKQRNRWDDDNEIKAGKVHEPWQDKLHLLQKDGKIWVVGRSILAAYQILEDVKLYINQAYWV